MDLDEAKRLLVDAGYPVTTENRLPNDTGTQLRLDCGAVVNIFDKGTFNVQGREAAPVKAALEGKHLAGQPRIAPHDNKVFVAYGHKPDVRTQLDAMLRRWGLEPIFLDQLPSEGNTIIEKLENYTKNINFGIVLATGDDEGHRRDHPDEKAFRSRQNVVLELGMLLAVLGRQKVAILLEQIENIERPSDIQGLIYIPFKDDLSKDAGLLLAKEMTAQGYNIDVRKL